MNGQSREAGREIRAWALLLALVLAAVPLRAEGQAYPTTGITVVHAQGEYDLSGVGWTHLYSVRAPIALNRWLVLEPGLTYFDYRTQFSSDVWYLIPEVQAQFTPLSGRFRPYLGAGVGTARIDYPEASVGGDVVLSAETDWVLTLSGAGGVRISLTDSWTLLGELRLWAIDPWTGVVSGFGAGIGWRF